MLNTFETVRDTRNTSMNHNSGTAVARSHSVNCVKQPLSGGLTMTPYPVGNKTSLSRNHASQIWSYYGFLSASHGRSFEICYQKVRAAPPGEWLMMTSYPVCNKTSLSGRLCVTDTNLVLNSFMKAWSLSNLYKKTTRIYSKTYQFIHVVNGMSRSHKKLICFFIWLISIAC